MCCHPSKWKQTFFQLDNNQARNGLRLKDLQVSDPVCVYVSTGWESQVETTEQKELKRGQSGTFGCSQRRIDADGCSRWGSDSHPRLSLRLRPAWIFLWLRCYVYSFIDLPLSSFPALVLPQHAPTGSAASSSVGFASMSSWLLSSLPSGPFPAPSPHPSSAQINYLKAHLIFDTYTHLHAHSDNERRA